MEAAASCRKDLCVLSARWARVPLEHREAVLLVHDVADDVADQVGEGALPARLGLTKT